MGTGPTRQSFRSEDNYWRRSLLLVATIPRTTPNRPFSAAVGGCTHIHQSEEIPMMMTMAMKNDQLHRCEKLPRSNYYKMGDDAEAPDRFLRFMRAASCREAAVEDVTYGRARATPYPAAAAAELPQDRRSTTQGRSTFAAEDYYGSHDMRNDSTNSNYSSSSAEQSGEQRIDDESKHSVSHGLMSWARKWVRNGFGRRKRQQQQELDGGHSTSRTTDSGGVYVITSKQQWYKEGGHSTASTADSGGVITSKQFSRASSAAAAPTDDHSTGSSVARRLHQIVASPPIICSAAAGSVVISSCTHTCSDIQHDVVSVASRIHRRRSRRLQHNASFHYDSVSYALNFDDGPHHFAAAVLRRTSSSSAGNANNIIPVPF